MAGFVAWIKAFAISLGGPGLFVIAFLDSSFLSFPEVNDLLIIWLTTQHKERMVYYALMTTLGSISGCLALYALARKGGEAFLLKRFNPKYVERAMTTFRRYGLLAILVPSILPPPTPFKILYSRLGSPKFAPSTSFWRSPSVEGFGILARACWRFITATRLRISSDRTPERSRLSLRWRSSSAASAGSSGSVGTSAQPFDDRTKRPV